MATRPCSTECAFHLTMARRSRLCPRVQRRMVLQSLHERCGSGSCQPNEARCKLCMESLVSPGCASVQLNVALDNESGQRRGGSLLGRICSSKICMRQETPFPGKAHPCYASIMISVSHWTLPGVLQRLRFASKIQNRAHEVQ